MEVTHFKAIYGVYIIIRAGAPMRLLLRYIAHNAYAKFTKRQFTWGQVIETYLPRRWIILKTLAYLNDASSKRIGHCRLNNLRRVQCTGPVRQICGIRTIQGCDWWVIRIPSPSHRACVCGRIAVLAGYRESSNQLQVWVGLIACARICDVGSEIQQLGKCHCFTEVNANEMP